MRKLFYLASPYGHKDPAVMQSRFEACLTAVAGFLTTGLDVYSPILHNHLPNVRFDMPRSWAFWAAFDLNMLERCDGLIVYTLDGWRESVGVSAEIAFAKEKGIEIKLYDGIRLETYWKWTLAPVYCRNCGTRGGLHSKQDCEPEDAINTKAILNGAQCDRAGCEKTLSPAVHYRPRNGKYYYCSEDCLLKDMRIRYKN